MADVKVIQGEIFQDARGQISSLNEFQFPEVKRFYVIHHPDTAVVRGWNAHQREQKWFYCIKGAFTVGLVKIDDWEKPSPELCARKFHLTGTDSKIVCVPGGYANCMKASIPGSILLVLSDKTMAETQGDSWRFDNKLWIQWEAGE